MASNGTTALVLEGGGYRGLFTAGVLDVFQEHGIRGFDSVWGTSAGALNAVNFLSRQVGRVMRTTLAFRDDRRLMSLYALATTGSIAGNDFVYGELQDRIDPFDYDAFNGSPTRMWAVATDVVFGAPAYLEVGRMPEDTDKVRASASLPVVSEAVDIGDHLYLDGGTADSVPVEAALGLDGARRPEGGGAPADRAVVVLTRERGYRKEGPYELMMTATRKYADYPYYLEALRTRPDRYNRQRHHMRDLEGEGRALVMTPPGPVSISTTEHDGGKLLELYLEGRREAEGRLDEVEAFVG